MNRAVALLEPAPAGCGPALPAAGAPRPLRRAIYETVRAGGRVSRAEVAKALDVSPASVTALTSDLIAAGHLLETEGPAPAPARRGRPPVALAVRPGAARVAGLRMSDESWSAVALDMGGAVLGEARRAAPPGRMDADTVEEAAAALLADLGRAARVGPEGFASVGVGLPGMVDHPGGAVAWSPLLLRRDLPLADLLGRRLGAPVLLENDAQAATLAELWFGAGRFAADFAVVTIENGLGMGLVAGNRLTRGGGGLGLELGHTKVQLDGALCRCGRRGCLEAYVADYALAREAETALVGGSRAGAVGADLLDRLHAEAKAGHPAAASIFRRAGRYMALALSNVALLFDPAKIILSGERMRYDQLHSDEVIEEMRRLLIDSGRPPPPVEIHAWGGSVWARGAAALALQHVTEAATG
ncbi:putative NBD/HSP70 family sugar kinase [Hasllibacter halocynthiae]|uniref:Putative NBD/HSP70 family sugar kinase n=1 Tax=Hasllibacter halocynthiae TaxID=595589 RepID=A0A2T0X2X8_9RHOB|nr:ROK family transcriptional regulator [Hasllibacter halocynthiae]PRY93288.1 putative NBD/HSP70 family sugar kinase [Hasllibacter halocynthiae]